MLKGYVVILSVVLLVELSQDTFPSLDFLLVCISSQTCCHGIYVLVSPHIWPIVIGSRGGEESQSTWSLNSCLSLHETFSSEPSIGYCSFIWSSFLCRFNLWEEISIYYSLIQSVDTVIVTNSRFESLEILFFLLSVKVRC
jgi:hypothetical protein